MTTKKSLLIIIMLIATTAYILSNVCVYKIVDLFIENKQTNDNWMLEHAEQELALFKRIDTDAINIFMQKLALSKEEHYKDCLVHIKIIDNKVYADIAHKNKRAESIIDRLNKILQTRTIDNVEFVIYLWDGAHYGTSTSHLDQLYKTLNYYPKFPIFVFAKCYNCSDSSNYINFPDATSIKPNKSSESSWECLSKKIIFLNYLHKWQNKINKAFWRGTDLFPDVSNNFRREAVSISHAHKDIIDAEFIKINSPLKSIKYFLCYNFSMFNCASKNKFLDYKMLLELDGNSASYPGTVWKLLSNSVVLKQETTNHLWFSSKLTPWVHYIPIKTDLSDLAEQANWVLNHDDEAKQISENANLLVRENMMIEDYEKYIIILLNQYSKRQKCF